MCTASILSVYALSQLLEAVVQLEARVEVQKQRADEIEKFIGLVR